MPSRVTLMSDMVGLGLVPLSGSGESDSMVKTDWN